MRKILWMAVNIVRFPAAVYCLTGICFLFWYIPAVAEDMTITTYYPSPNGTYDALSVKRLSVGDTNADGYINASDVPATSGYLLVADRLGIGTTTPQTQLQINAVDEDYTFPNPGSTARGALFIRSTTSDKETGITFSSANSNNAQAGIYVHQDSGAGTHMYLATTDSYATGPQARMTVLNNGNVGIGTVSPSQKLDVNGSVRFGTGGGYLYSSAGDNFTLQTVTNTPNPNLTIGYGNGSGAGSIDTSREYLSMNAGKFMFNNGNVGIGTTSPGGKLDVYATVATWGGWYEAIRLSQSAHSAITHPGGGLLFGLHGNRNFYWADTTNGWYAMILNANGALTIRGAASLAGDLTVTNGIFRSGTRSNFFLALQGDRNVVVYDNGGAIWASGTSTSDIRLKKNIKDLGKVIDKLEMIRAINFNFKDDEFNKREIGVIAQELEKDFPELIYTDPKSGYKLVDYPKLTVLLLQAVKDLRAEEREDTRVLTEEIKEMKREIAALKKTVHSQ